MSKRNDEAAMRIGERYLRGMYSDEALKDTDMDFESMAHDLGAAYNVDPEMVYEGMMQYIKTLATKVKEANDHC